MGNYVFTRCYFRFEWFEHATDEHRMDDFEMDYPEGPKSEQVGLRASYIAVAIKDRIGLTMVSSVDDYFTFDLSENIAIHPSVWYTCNCLDAEGAKRQIHIKVSGIKHIGADTDAI